MPTSIDLSDGWQFAQLSSKQIPDAKTEWSKCSKVPTSVHVELLKQGKIKDPFKGLNEWDVQWIGEAAWGFKTTINVSEEQMKDPQADLVFGGLDTYCDISLNGKKLAHVENMFHEHRLSCKSVLKKGDNELLLEFAAPWEKATDEENAHKHNGIVWNGTPNRLYSRKAQYGWGWDWGPILMTTGPWRPVRFETYAHRLSDVRVDTSLKAPSYKEATLRATFSVSPAAPSGCSLKATLRKKNGQMVKESTQAGDAKPLEWRFQPDEVEAWWPIGYGNQVMYDLDVVLIDKSQKEMATSRTQVFFRDAQVVQEKLIDQPGLTFLFQINGVRMFCGGSNWIPGDSFLTEIEPQRYRDWVNLLVEGNQNMLRIWGGGIYESPALYEACDEAGILVWQDFMFGCGSYPSYDSINKSIKTEAEHVVALLRNHPSVVIFAGNNEDYQLAESNELIDYSDESGNYMNTRFPARQIYEVILPEVVSRLSTIHYHRSSPYSGQGQLTTDQTLGDLHQWNVWHGSQEKWSDWDKLAGRFVSEFGMQGYPDRRTVDEWDDDKKQLFPQSRVSANHNKAGGYERRLELYLMENFRHAFDMDSYIYYTQIMQAECLSAAYRAWRREWRGKGKEYTAGALVWQINDCWPCVSWAIADYYLRPKPAFFAIARELRQFTVGMDRRDIKKLANPETTSFFSIKQEMSVWCCNSSLQTKKARVELVAFDLSEGEVARKDWDVTLQPNASTEIWRGDVPGQPVRTSDAEVPKPIVVQCRLLDENDTVLARYCNWPEPWKYLIFPEPGLTMQVKGDEVTLECKIPIKGIILDVKEGERECKWSDQAIDLFPGDTQKIVAKGLDGREVRARHIGDGSA